MTSRSYIITVTDDGTTISVKPHKLNMAVNDDVRWELVAAGSRQPFDIVLKPSKEGEVSEEGCFKGNHFVIGDGGIRLLAHCPGRYSYTISTRDGRRRIDPVIIIDPIAPP